MKKILYLLVAMFTMALSATPLHAEDQLININFASRTYNGAAASTGFSTIQTWNHTANADGATVSNLLNSAGATTSVSVTYATDGFTSINRDEIASYPSGAYQLMGDYIYNSGSYPYTITLNGLIAGEQYDLYIYTQAEDDIATPTQLSVSVNGGSYFTSNQNNGLSADFVQNTNYILGQYTANGSGALVISYKAAGANSKTVINGLQVKGPTPEPASMLLLGVGGVLAALKLRRKNSEASGAAAA